MKALLILNPGSRAGRGCRLWARWQDRLQRAGVPFDAAVTRGIGHAFETARNASGHDTLVAVGGDGTINEVLDGLLQSARANLRMGVLYAGTSPDFCRFHGIPVDPDAALSALLSERVHAVDAVRIQFAAADGSRRIAHFGCGCNIGFGASVARFSNRVRPLLGDRLGTGLAVLQALMKLPPVDLDLEIDGERMALPRANHLAVLKNPFIASGLKLDTGLQPDDGRMFAAGLHGKGLWGLCRALPSFYIGALKASGGVFLRTCSRISVSQSTEPLGSALPQPGRIPMNCEIEFDGDPRGFLPVEIEIRPRVLQLIGGAP